MKAKRIRTFALGLLAMITVVGVSPARTQEKPADNMQILREKVRADKKLLVRAGSTAKIDRDAKTALEKLYAESPAAKTLGEKAKGILVFPAIAKGGFIVGGAIW